MLVRREPGVFWRRPSAALARLPGDSRIRAGRSDLSPAQSAYQSRNQRPASAPSPMQMSVASGYQVATNKGESPGQDDA